MSLDKSIDSGKDHREQYHGSKSFDPSCRNHGGCPWCEENRKYKYIKKRVAMDEREKEWRDCGTE